MPIPPEEKTPSSYSEGKGNYSRWLLLFSVLIAAALLYSSLRGLDWDVFFKIIKSSHYQILLVIIPVASANYFIRALRWGVFLRSEKKIPILTIFWANMIGYMGNAFLPARTGELLRSGFLGTKSGLGISFVLATGLAERLLDAISLVLIGSVALLWYGQIPSVFMNAVRAMAIAGLVGLVFFILVPFYEKTILRLFNILPIPGRISEQAARQVSRFLLGMRSLQNVRRLLIFITLTAVIWFVDAMITSISAGIISQNLNLSEAFILLSALGLSSAIPSTPGYIGIYQFVAINVLVPFGFTRAEALAFITISQFTNYIIVTFWGLLGLWKINKPSTE
jgi:glycosyltransferase 2 family protein